MGYRVFIPLSTYSALPPLGESAQLFTITVVREDAFHLYGFHEEKQKRLFGLLTSVSGVGAKIALALLSTHPADALAQAIANGDITAISRAPGVGKKGAQRIAMELKEKMAALGGFAAPGGVALPGGEMGFAAPVGLREEAASALVNLGYKRNQADAALAKALNSGDIEDLGELIKVALKLLSPQS
ncbi:putative Holliday junction DNA helicase RuvA [Magnetofaba australis IT-1]|uniref:Holliday junction branch migration complex subunit RuvA n=1 Tax=Magnetofaba australis IT-1 TaxID=1434232 RepID=A0A1Y2K271_9PROT|nr:putative Holliday junction DNA helicase RuvA [Magnetofaba australis IT-1]